MINLHIGQTLYVNGRVSTMSPDHDRTGGLATVKSWRMRTSAGKQVPFVTFREVPGELNYEMLMSQQANLAAHYGDRRAKHCPGDGEDDDFGGFA